MGYQPKPRGRTYRGFKEPKRGRSKTVSKKSRLIDKYSEEQNAPTIEEVVRRTLNSLSNLGSQKFALAPFYEHFDRWLTNLQTVLTDFESSQTVMVDGQFREECSKIFSYIKSALMDKRLVEVSREEAIRRIPNSKNLLSQIEQEHVKRTKEIIDRKEEAIKPLKAKVDKLQWELNDISHIRTGFLRGISKEVKAQKEEEATLKLASAKKELEEVARSFTFEEIGLREGYEHKKQEILEQITKDQKEVERLEANLLIDDSTEVRRITCENLTNTVKALLKRIKPYADDVVLP
jgi:hypothetical protein